MKIHKRNGIVGGRKKRIDEELCRCDQAKEAGDAEEAEEVGAFHVVMCSMEPSMATGTFDMGRGKVSEKSSKPYRNWTDTKVCIKGKQQYHNHHGDQSRPITISTGQIKFFHRCH